MENDKTKAKQDEVQEIELDEKAEKALIEKVADSVSEKMQGKLEKVAGEAVKGAVEKLGKEQIEKIVKKNVNGGADPKKEDEETDEVQKSITEETKEKRLVKAASALIRGDRQTLRGYNEHAIKLREKAGYASTDVNADGGYVVLDPEFEAEVEKLAEEYGVAFTEASVRPLNSNSIKTNKRGSNVTMFETNQAASKTGTKLTIEQVTVELRKFAAIAIATDELIEDAAIDFWAEVTDGFAEERARIADELVFTDDDEDYPGILNTTGVIIESVGDNFTEDATWDHLMNAEVAVPTRAMKNGKHFMHRTVWNVYRQSKDSEGRYQLVPSAGLQTPWGTPVVLVDVLTSVTEIGANGAASIFGDLKRAKLYVKRGLILTQDKSATVTDADGNTVNLFEQDMTALRAVTRMVTLIKFPNAFCVVGTGTVS